MSPCGLRGGDPGAEPPKFDTGEACGNLGDNTMDISRFFRLFIPIRVLVGTDQHAGIDDVFQVAFPAVATLICRQTIEHRAIGGMLQIAVD